MSALPAWADATATKNGGDWFDDNVWTNGIPSGADEATISAGHKLSIERVGACANILYDNGSLEVRATGSPAGALGVGLQLVVGHSGFGEVTVSASGHVASARFSRSTWTNSSALFVGYEGEGTPTP